MCMCTWAGVSQGLQGDLPVTIRVEQQSSDYDLEKSGAYPLTLTNTVVLCDIWERHWLGPQA